MGKDPVDEPAPEVTAPVTEPTGPPPPWELAGLTETQWHELTIPEFLIRRETGSPTVHAPAAPAASPAGGPSGPSTKMAIPSGATGDFSQFRVDPEEIEAKIKAEADRLYYTWEGKHRPRKSTLIKRVRKEYYK